MEGGCEYEREISNGPPIAGGIWHTTIALWPEAWVGKEASVALVHAKEREVAEAVVWAAREAVQVSDISKLPTLKSVLVPTSMHNPKFSPPVTLEA